MGRTIIVAFVLCLAANGAFAQSQGPSPSAGKTESQQPQSPAQSTQQQAAPDQRGTESAPVVVKVLPAPKSKEETEQEQADRQDVSSANWWMVRLTGLIALIGILQGVVFWIQAGRLKNTITKMDEIAGGQTADMAKMIDQTTKSAEAMGRVADGIAENVANSTTLIRNQREFWQKQMRAYVYSVIGAAIYQERPKKLRFEAKPVMVNFGNTPAHNVRYRAKAAVMPIPIASSFDFPLTGEYGGGAVMGPHANFIMNALVEEYVPDQDVDDIKQGKGRALVVWGRIEYTLVTGEDVHTNFCQIYTWLANGTVYGYYAPAHNDAT